MFYFSAKCSRGDILLSNKYMESTLDTFLATQQFIILQ